MCGEPTAVCRGTKKLREGYARVARMSSTLGSGRQGYLHFSILRSFQASLFFPSKGRSGLVPYYARQPVSMLLPSLLARLPQGGDMVGPTPRVSNDHCLIVGVPRANGTTILAPAHVSIISSRASNSCPQDAQRIQSDSTTNSSMRTPMPPQSGHRARWTL